MFSYYVDYIDVLFLDLMDGGRSDCWEMLGASDHTNNWNLLLQLFDRIELHE